MKDVFREMLKLPLVRSIIFGILCASFLVGSLSGLNQALAASVQDCDSNAVIYCGVTSVGDLQSKYNNGDGQHSGGNIQHIFNWFGISDSDMESLGNTAKNGKVTDKGNVYLDDEIIATDATTAGRQNMSGSTKHTSQDTTFYTRPPSVSFTSQSLDAYIIMKDDVFQYAILKSCGNPVKATPKAKPAPQPAPTPAPAPAPAPPPPAAAPQPSICSGETTNSNSNVASQGGNCSINTTTVVVQTPPTPAPPPPQTPAPSGQCENLQVTTGSSNNGALTVTASVNYSALNGARLQSITYDFGDGSVTPPTTETSTTHTYQKPGSYNITATLAFSTGQSTTTTASTPSSNSGSTDTMSAGSNPNNAATDTTNTGTNPSDTPNTGTDTVAPSSCQASVTVTAAPAPPPPTPPPVPAPTPPATPTNTLAPVQPVAAPTQQLLKTGVESTVGLFGATSIVSTLAYRFYLRRHLAA